MPTTKSLLLTAFILAFAGLGPIWADANFSFTGEGQLSRHFDSTSPLTDFSHNAIGGTLLLEFQPIDIFSIGGDFGFDNYFGLGGQSKLASSFDAVVRFMPFPSNTISPYLLGSYGVNPFGTTHPGVWPAQTHFSLGAGFRYFVLPQWALDFGGSFENYNDSNANANLGAINLHAGLAFFVASPFKNSDKMVWAGGGVTVMQPVTITETDQESQSIQDIAQNEYADSSLYPLIIDANFKDKSKPLILPPGIQLIIPQNPTAEMIADAHLKAKMPEYKNAADTFQMPQIENVQYRLEPAESDNAVDNGPKDQLTFQADSLWDIAARPDVYGDPELYPLLVDANFEKLSDPLLLKPGTQLVIPHKVSKAKIQQARIKAWTAEYLRWRGAEVSHEEYREWRKEKGLPAIDEVTGEVIQPGNLGE
jgi:hypothetical protein